MKFNLLLLLPALAFPLSVNGQELASHITSITDAKPIDRIEPRYPINEARSGREGWVRLSFVVEPDGTTSNAVVEDSSGSRSFEKESLKAIKKWTFSPAIENGQPIQQCKTSVQMDFAMARDSIAVSRKFLKKFNKLNQAIIDKNIEEADELAETIAKHRLYTGAEEYYRHAILADYQLLKGNKRSALYHLGTATRFIGAQSLFKMLKQEDTVVSSVGIKIKKRMTKEQIENKKRILQKKTNQQKISSLRPLLHKRLVIALELGSIAEALDANEKLLLIATEDKMPLYQRQLDHLNSIINSDEPLLTPASINHRDFWRYRLMRNNFTFKNIEGKLNKMDVRCRNKRHVYSINEHSTWQIPSNWQDCSIMVYGDQKTTFTLVELMPSAKTAQQSAKPKQTSLSD